MGLYLSQWYLSKSEHNSAFGVQTCLHVIPLSSSLTNTPGGHPRKKIGTIGNQKENRDHPDYSIVEIGQNPKKSPGELWTLAVSQISVKVYVKAGVKIWK